MRRRRALLSCLSTLALLAATPFIASRAHAVTPHRAVKTYEVTLRGTDVGMTPPPHCRHTDEDGYRLRVCLDIVVQSVWSPSTLPPFLGGELEASTHAIGTYHVSYTASGQRVVPYKVKLFVENDTDGHRWTGEHFCGWTNPCAKANNGVAAPWEGFYWNYQLPPFSGCADLHTHAQLQATVWPTVHVQTILLFRYLELGLTAHVCTP